MFRPFGYIVIHLIGCHTADDISADIVQFIFVEKTAGRAHLLYAERKLGIRFVGIGGSPFLVI